MTAEKTRPVAMIDDNGHLTVDADERPEDGRLTLRFHSGTTQAVAFLFRALRASKELRVISMVPIRGGRSEVVFERAIIRPCGSRIHGIVIRRFSTCGGESPR